MIRRPHEGLTTRETDRLPPVETRPFTFVETGPDGRPVDRTAVSRIGLNYTEPTVAQDGEPEPGRTESYEIVTSFTQLAENGRTRNVRDISDNLRDKLAPAVTAEMLKAGMEPQQLTGLSVVEFPESRPGYEFAGENGLPGLHLGFAVETTGIGKITFYSLVERRYPSGDVEIEAVEKADVANNMLFWLNQPVPPGSRVTNSVRGQAPARGGGTTRFAHDEENRKNWPYERTLTDAARRALDAFDPNRHQKSMSVSEAKVLDSFAHRIPADHGRSLNFIPGQEATPERPSQVRAAYSIETASGEYNVHQLIEGRTVPRAVQMSYADIDDMFDALGDELLDTTPLEGGLKAMCLIEVPCENEDSPIDATVITGDANGMMSYTVTETGKGISVSARRALGTGEKAKKGLLRGRKKRKDGRAAVGAVTIPKDSRITFEVRGRIPVSKNDKPVKNDEPVDESRLMDDIRNAIIDFNEAHHPSEGDIRLK